MSGPTTEAGQRLLDNLTNPDFDKVMRAGIARSAIRAIEQEAVPNGGSQNVAGDLLLSDWDDIPIENRSAIIEQVRREERERLLRAVLAAVLAAIADEANK